MIDVVGDGGGYVGIVEVDVGGVYCGFGGCYVGLGLFFGSFGVYEVLFVNGIGGD